MEKILSTLLLLIGFTNFSTANNDKFLSDLAIYDGSLSSHYALPGESITVNLTIANWGNSNSTSTTIGYYLSKNSIRGDSDDIWISENTTIASLSPSGFLSTSQVITIPTSISDNDHYKLFFEVDINNSVVESNENNNWNVLNIDIGRPNFIFSSTSSDPSAPLGGSININGELINNGLSGVQQNSKIIIVLSDDLTVGDSDDIFIKEYTVGWMGTTQQSFVFNFDWSISSLVQAGSYNIILIADSDNQVLESNEADNKSVLGAIDFFEGIDLTPFQVSTDQQSYTEGDPISVSIQVLNLGNETVAANSSYRVIMKLRAFGQQDIQFYNSFSFLPFNLLGGASYTDVVTTNLPSSFTSSDQNFELIVEINPYNVNNSIVETVYSNNDESTFVLILNSGGGAGGGGPGGPGDQNEQFISQDISRIRETLTFEKPTFFPNPTEDFIKVALPYSTNFELIIRDISGNLKKKKHFKNTNSTLVDVQNFKEGFYIIRIKSLDYRISQKFLKK